MKKDKKLWNEPLTKGELDLLLHKFKTYLGSVSRELQNRRLKDIPYQGDNGFLD